MRIGPLTDVQAQRASSRSLPFMYTKIMARPTAVNTAADSKCNDARVKRSRRGVRAFTLAEVVMCIAIVALMFGGIIAAYIQGAYRAEWAGYNLAAQSLAMQ